VIGQDDVVQSIQSALGKKRGRAFLLTGGSGVGKTTLGRLIAKQVGCSEHDVIEEDGATNTGIDAVRAIQNRLQFKSLTGSARTVIIDESHSLSKAAWQSLLKVLEEPPPDVYWVLCTTESDKVPKTVRTRCLAYDLQPVGVEKIVALLQKVRDAEVLKIRSVGLRLVAEAAEGSPRQALAFLATVGHLKSEQQIRPLLAAGPEEKKEVIDLCRALLACASGGSTSWKKMTSLLRALSAPPESTRIVVLRYMAAVALSGSDKSLPALQVMEAFSEPFLDREGPAPIVRACARVLMLDEDEED